MNSTSFPKETFLQFILTVVIEFGMVGVREKGGERERWCCLGESKDFGRRGFNVF